jgi:hypothetical protein
MTQGKVIFIGFLFFCQGDYRRIDQIIRIDIVLSRGVVEHLLESSMVVIMLKIPILVRNELKYYESLSFLLVWQRKLRVWWAPTKVIKNNERILFLLKIERVEWPPHGLIATKAGLTISATGAVWPSGVVGLTASFYITHGLTTWDVSQTVNTSNGRFLKLKIIVASVVV